MLRFMPEQRFASANAADVRRETVVPKRRAIERGVDFSQAAQLEVAALYEERAEELLHYARNFGRNEGLAQDALQEAFMRYFAALCEGDEITSPRAWIYRVMHNYLLDRMKEIRRRNEHRLNERFPYEQEQDIEAACFRGEFRRAIRGALTAREYDCFRLRSEGMRYEEIAATLHLTSGTVGTLVYRAVKKLRDIFTVKRGEA